MVFNLPELVHLYLSKCSITIWPDVYGCLKLRHLDLNFNKIPSLPSSHMVSPDNALENLYLRANPIEVTLQGVFVENLDYLKDLDLSGYRMTGFPNISLVIDTLVALRLSSNQLSPDGSKSLVGSGQFYVP